MSSNRELDRVRRFAEGVRSGKIPSCRLIRKAVDRWFNDCERPDLYFDPKPFNLFCAFSSEMKHYKGEFAGKPFQLEDWQLFIAANVLGWYRKATRRRRYTAADILVPRKNGKTMFAAILAAFLAFLDGEAGAEVYTAAVDKAQAKICFDAAKKLLQSSIFTTQVKPYQGRVEFPRTDGVLMPLSKETKNKDGLNPHAAVCDERHAWVTNELNDVIKTGMGARSQPMIISITTAGLDTSLPYYRDLQVYIDVLDGIKEMDDHFLMLYMPDDGADYNDREVWKAVNPNLGISLSWEYMENMYNEAKQKGGSTLTSFLVKNLNMWVDAPEVWISDDDVIACNKTLSVPDLSNQECYVGIDLAAKTDITAVALYFPAQDAFKYLFVVPEAKVEAMKDLVDYRLWSQQGWLTVSPGKVLDEDWFVSYLLSELDKYKVKAIAYDPWGMWNILDKFGRYREALMEYPQNIRHMSVPTKHFESAVLKHELNFCGNPVMRWMMKNVVVYTDPNGNIKLDKAKSRNKIDGVVASVDAIGAWLTKTSGKKAQIYTSHSLRTVSL